MIAVYVKKNNNSILLKIISFIAHSGHLQYTLNVWSGGKQLVLFSQNAVEGNKRTGGEMKQSSFPRDHTLKASLYI